MQEAPEIGLGLELFYKAFQELNSCRQFGFGEGPIPWSAMSDWAYAHGLDEEQREDMFYLVRQLDLEFLKYMAEKRKKGEGK